MAVIRPFSCIRPRKDMAEHVAALPYDVYNTEEARREIDREPFSFLKIDRPETQFEEGINPYDKKVYEKAHEILMEWIDNGILLSDPEKCYYIYELMMNGRTQTGIVGCASIEDYEKNVIRKHENTRREKEEDRICHVNICNAHTGPIFLAYHARKEINQMICREKEKEPLYSFTAADEVRHQVWKIDSQATIAFIQREFENLDHIYIADGHHRAASAVRVGQMRREQNSKQLTGDEEFLYFLSVLFSDDQLMILDYNRVVRDLNGYTTLKFLKKVQEVFEITEIGAQPYQPKSKHEIGMYLEEKWYQLTVKKHLIPDDPVESLDVSLLQGLLLEPILGIKDPKTDERIDFIGGIRGLEELEYRVHTDMAVAFAMYPTSIEELFAVSDAGRLMPPKSTWFEPKLRSGLFIHSL